MQRAPLHHSWLDFPGLNRDALHLALATLHECDILMSWNCRHIANASKFDHVRKINGRLGCETPKLITPLELMKETP